MMPSFRAARELIAFYVDSGADALIGETPVDRMAETAAVGGAQSSGLTARVSEKPARTARAEPRAFAQAPAAQRPSPPASPEAAIMAARAAATDAKTLEELRALLAAFEGCALRTTATQLVFADGNPQGRVMFVGEAPGYDEDIVGRPFVGRSGKRLDLMMAAIKLDRETAYIANVVPWRPPGNRTPTPQESQICLPFLKRQIELADPDILVCLGGPSATALLGMTDGIRKFRGRWRTYHTGTREIRAIASFHPSYLLRSPLEKRFAWRDFQAIRAALAA